MQGKHQSAARLFNPPALLSRVRLLLTMHRSRTNTWIRVSQVAAAAGLAGAGLAGAFVGHTPAPVPAAVVELPAFTPLDEASQQQGASLATPGTAQRFAFIANKPKPAAPAPAAPAGPPPPPPPPPPPSVTYHGMVIGNAPLALLKDGTKQLFVKVGDIVQGKRVELIEAEQVRLGPADGGMLVPLAGRTGAAVTIANAQPAAPAQDALRAQQDAHRAMLAAIDLESNEKSGRFDFRAMLNGDAPPRLVPSYVSPEDAAYFLFVRERMLRNPQGEMDGEALDKAAWDQVQNNREQFRELANKQLGGDRVDEMIKIEALRQSELRERFQQQGLTREDASTREKFNKEAAKGAKP